MTDSMYHNERTKAYDIPISHLDFKYIKECQDINELEKIMKTLRSGEVGRYAELERCCEDCIRKIDPDHRVLRVAVPLGSLAQLDQSVREEVENGFKSWLEEMKSGEQDAGDVPSADALVRSCHGKTTLLESEVEERGLDYDDDVPAVRREIFFKGNSTSAIRARCDGDGNKPKRIVKPRDYSEWDKLEKEWDKELTEETSNAVQRASTPEKGEKMEVSDAEVRSIQKLNLIELSKRVESLPEHTRRQLAVREKEKGNEAFHSGDYNEALLYYKRSLTIFPMTAVYNNRALIYLQQKQWSAAAKDCARVLQEEPDNLKALFRSGRANYELHNLDQAELDLERLTDQEPTNSKAQALLRTVRLAKSKRQTSRLAGGRRMLITEEGDSASSDEDSTAHPRKLDITVEQSSISINSGSIPEKNSPERTNGYFKLNDTSEKAPQLESNRPNESSMIKSNEINSVNPKGSIRQPRVRARKVYPPSHPGPYGREGMVIEELSDSEEVEQPSTLSETAKSTDDEKQYTQVEQELQDNLVHKPKEDSSQGVHLNKASLDEAKPSLPENSPDKRRITTFVEAKEQGKQLLDKGDLQGALEAYTRSLELAAGTPEQLAVSFRNRALVALRMNENTMAVKDCNEAIKIEPQNPVSYYRRALGLRALKKYQESLNDLEKAHQLRPDSENIKTELKKARSLLASVTTVEDAKHTIGEVATDGEDPSSFEIIHHSQIETQVDDLDHRATGRRNISAPFDWEVVNVVSSTNNVVEKKTEDELREALEYISKPPDSDTITPCLFQHRWTTLKGLQTDELNKTVIKLLHDTKPDRLKEVIGIKLDAIMLDRIISACNWLCCTAEKPKPSACEFVFTTLDNLVKLPRFDCALFLIEDTTIRAINMLFEFLQNGQNVTYDGERLRQLKYKFTI